MKKMRFLSLILAVLLLVAAVPFTASALTEDGKIETADLANTISDSRLSPYLLNSQYHIETIVGPDGTRGKVLTWEQDGTVGAHGVGMRADGDAAKALLSQPFTFSATLKRGTGEGSNPGPNEKQANILRFECGSAKIQIKQGWSTLYYGDNSTYFYYDKTSSKAVTFDKGYWATLKMWVDPTKNEDNVKFYIDDQLLYVGSERDDAISVDFSNVGTLADLTTMHSYSTTFSNDYWADNLSLVSDDLTKEGAYNAVMEFSTVPTSPNEMSYGTNYTLFADEGASADDVLDPYVRYCAKETKWSLTQTQKGSNQYTIYEGEMPVTMTVLTMNETTDKETPVALYAINTSDPDAKDLSAAENTELIMELLKMGFIVVVTDFADNPAAVSPNLDWAIKAMRIKLAGTSIVSYAHHTYDIYLVPEGYLVARNLAFFDFDEHAVLGTEEYIVKMFNGVEGKGSLWSAKTVETVVDALPEGAELGADKGVSNLTTYTYYLQAEDGTITQNVTTYAGFRYSKISSIPVDEEAAARGEYETYPGVYDKSGNKLETENPVVICDKNGKPLAKRVTATNYETCLNKDGKPIELRLNQDIIYPTTVENSPVVLISSSSEEKMDVCATKKERPLDDAFLLNGCAVAIFEHVYAPMSRTDHYGYFSPGFSMNSYLAPYVQSAAARCVRYFADAYGYDTENYAAMGHSKGSYAALLASPHPEKLEPDSNPGGFTKGVNHGEQPYLCYADGTPIKSGVDMVYSSMGPGIHNSRASFISEGGANMLLACGLWDTDVSDSWTQWTTKGLSTAFEEYGVSYVALTELELDHDYPYLVDNYYNYDRYVAFADIMTYNIKDGIAPRILYSSIVDARVVDRAFDADGDGVADETITITKPQYATEADGLGDSVLDKVTGDIAGKVVGTVVVTNRKISSSTPRSVTLTRATDLYVQFTCAVTEASVQEHMYLKDSSGNPVEGKLVGTAGGTKWEFVPSAALTDGSTYTLVVEAGIVDVKNAMATTDSANYTFTWGE